MESFYRSYYLMPQAGHVPTPRPFHPAQRKDPKKSPSVVPMISGFLQLVGLASASEGSTQKVPRLPSLAGGNKKHQSQTEATESTITDASLSSLSDATPPGTPSSVFSHWSEASSATSLASELPDSPASLSCPIASQVLRPNSITSFAPNGPGTGGDSSTCANNHFGETEASFDDWLQDSVLWAHDHALVCGKGPLASRGDDGLFLEGDITSDDWCQMRFSWDAMVPPVTENKTLNPKAANMSGTSTPEASGDTGTDFEDRRLACAPLLFKDAHASTSDITSQGSGSGTVDRPYQPAAGVMDPSDGQVWMFYDSDSDVDNDEERDTHKAYMEHIEEWRRRRGISTGPTPLTTTMAGSSRVKSAHPTRQPKASRKGRHGHGLLPRFYGRSTRE